MGMIDHLSLGVSDIAAARAFYDPTLAAIGCDCLGTGDRFAAYGRAQVEFLVMTPFDGEPASAGNSAHVCFAAPFREAVDAFHAAGLAADGADEGAPEPRDASPMPDVYAAYVRDLFGNKLEIIHNGFAR